MNHCGPNHPYYVSLCLVLPRRRPYLPLLRRRYFPIRWLPFPHRQNWHYCQVYEKSRWTFGTWNNGEFPLLPPLLRLLRVLLRAVMAAMLLLRVRGEIPICQVEEGRQ